MLNQNDFKNEKETDGYDIYKKLSNKFEENYHAYCVCDTDFVDVCMTINKSKPFELADQIVVFDLNLTTEAHLLSSVYPIKKHSYIDNSMLINILESIDMKDYYRENYYDDFHMIDETKSKYSLITHNDITTFVIVDAISFYIKQEERPQEYTEQTCQQEINCLAQFLSSFIEKLKIEQLLPNKTAAVKAIHKL